MILPSDQDYLQTKRLKKEAIPLEGPFRELAAWVSSTYQVSVLNILHDIVAPDARPRLRIILEFTCDALKFREANSINFDSAKQTAICDHFLTLLPQHGNHRFKVNGLFVVFSAFEDVARIEANARVTKRELEILQTRLANETLWLIRTAFDGVIFFFHTDAQVKETEGSVLRETFAQEYARLVEPYDEFGYLRRRGIAVGFDSKENFDTKYQSNWFYYFR